ncbi:MAG: C69 family dipeptidase, partial [Bacillota bacterium]
NLDRHRMLEQQISMESTIDAQMLMGYLREVYENSPIYKEGHRGSPFRTGVRTIARLNTEASVVIELQRNLPPKIGIRLWCNMATSLSGVYVPFHLGSAAVERHYAFAGREYSKKSAYWRFVELSRLLDYGYHDCSELIKNCWRDFESDALRQLPEQEEKLSRIKVKKLGKQLAKIDRRYAKNALRKLERLLPTVKTKVFYEDF